MAQGKRLCTLALIEESAAFEPDATAVREDVSRRINGRKLFVKDAHVVDDLIVVVRGDGGFNLVLVERD
jgi:alkylation response protein AidB-like acyl-CoA dehydrogenase